MPTETFINANKIIREKFNHFKELLKDKGRNLSYIVEYFI